MDRQRDWLTLIRAPGLGGQRLIDSLDRHGTVAELLRAARGHSGDAGLPSEAVRFLRRPDEDRLEQDLKWLASAGRHLVAWDDERYPPLLRRIPSPPAALFVEGDPDTLWQPQLAMVGSRNPTAGGLDHARDFSREMVRLGLVVTSGLASGIDRACHEAAIEAGGRTVAVTGTGLDEVYPASSRALAERIPAQGAMVSEFAPGTPARRGHFPARNRIIAGLSLGVLVVEAGLNSGSLITARLAAEQGREVFALPGSLHNPMVKGCHRLIKQGARLVEDSAELLEALTPAAGELAALLRQALNEAPPQAAAGADGLGNGSQPDLLEDADYARLWSFLGFDPKSIDRLVADSGLPTSAVSSMLLMMELRGMVEAHPGARYSRR